MDEVRAKWEELRLLLCAAQAVSEELATVLQAVRPLPVGAASSSRWSASDRLEWRSWWDSYCDLDFDLWQAYCHGHQGPTTK